jgi:transcription elongation GreA/GreB family factor
MTYFVANPANKQPGYLLASPESPLGKALIGAVPGDKVTYDVEVAGKTKTFSILIKDVRPFRD